MPIIVHFGNPRQGKSYSAVADHIVPALGKGRRVVTNIEGMGDPTRKEKLQALVQKRFKYDGEIDLHFVPHSKLERETIFPIDTKREDEDGTRVFDDSQSVVKFGTLIVWDEARSFTTDQLPKVWHDALTYHGHWARGGVTVDIVLIHQNWKSLAPLVRATSELVYEFVKKTSGKGYTRFTYASPGDRELSRKAGETLSESFTYDPEIFALYKTNSDDGPTNDNIAIPFWKTQYFKSKLRLIIILGVLGLLATSAAIYRLLGSIKGNDPAPAQTVQGVSGQVAAPIAGTVASSGPQIVGKVPTAGGFVAIVKDGERFETVTPKGGEIIYSGRRLQWPSDF